VKRTYGEEFLIPLAIPLSLFYGSYPSHTETLEFSLASPDSFFSNKAPDPSLPKINAYVFLRYTFFSG